MEIHSYEIKISSRRFKIRLLGDLQKDHPCFTPWLWRKFKLDSFNDKESYFLGTGDYFDTLRPSIRAKFDHALLEDSESRHQISEPIKRKVEKFAKELEPIRNRIIGLLEGHHYFNMEKGKTSTQYLCELLGCRYLGFVGFVNLHVERCGRDRDIINIFATHGEGGGSGIGADFARIEKNLVPSWDADIFVRGHSTKVGVGYASDRNDVMTNRKGVMVKKIRHRLMVNNGGFLDGYREGISSYVEQANMAPAALGWAWIDVHLTNRGPEISGTAFAP